MQASAPHLCALLWPAQMPLCVASVKPVTPISKSKLRLPVSHDILTSPRCVHPYVRVGPTSRRNSLWNSLWCSAAKPTTRPLTTGSSPLRLEIDAHSTQFRSPAAGFRRHVCYRPAAGFICPPMVQSWEHRPRHHGRQVLQDLGRTRLVCCARPSGNARSVSTCTILCRWEA